MPGCEITTFVVGADGVRCDLHMNCIAFDRATGTLSVAVPAKPGVAYKVKFITTKRGIKVDPVKTVEIPAKGKRSARRVPVYSDGVGAVAQTTTLDRMHPLVKVAWTQPYRHEM